MPPLSPQHARRTRYLAQLLEEEAAREELLLSSSDGEEETDPEPKSGKKPTIVSLRIPEITTRHTKVSSVTAMDEELIRTMFLKYDHYQITKATICQYIAMQFNTDAEEIAAIIQKQK